jgi:hypothetical protein
MWLQTKAFESRILFSMRPNAPGNVAEGWHVRVGRDEERVESAEALKQLFMLSHLYLAMERINFSFSSSTPPVSSSVLG